MLCYLVIHVWVMVYMEKHHLLSSNFATPRGDIYQCLGTLLIVTTRGKGTTDN